MDVSRLLVANCNVLSFGYEKNYVVGFFDFNMFEIFP